MDGQAPTVIYDQLVDERGDIPAQVRAAAEELIGEVESKLNAFTRPAQDDPWFR
jgi:hypothetical protein